VGLERTGAALAASLSFIPGVGEVIGVKQPNRPRWAIG